MGIVPNELDADVPMAWCRSEDVSTQNADVYSISCIVDTQFEVVFCRFSGNESKL
jgi:hypothetical protein